MGVRKTSRATRSPLLCKPSTGPQAGLPRHADPIARRKPGPVHRSIFLWHDQIDPFAQGFFWRMAEQSLRAGVPETDAAIRASIDDCRMAVGPESRAKSFEVGERRHGVYSFDPRTSPSRPSAATLTLQSRALLHLGLAPASRLATRPARAFRRSCPIPPWRPDRTAPDPAGSPTAPSADSCLCLSE